jgi:hypothetical protein
MHRFLDIKEFKGGKIYFSPLLILKDGQLILMKGFIINDEVQQKSALLH